VLGGGSEDKLNHKLICTTKPENITHWSCAFIDKKSPIFSKQYHYSIEGTKIKIAFGAKLSIQQ
jgi:hypothetical protein